jgi:dienelactone hydrolase
LQAQQFSAWSFVFRLDMRFQLPLLIVGLVISQSGILAAVREVAPPIAPRYATDRKMLPTDFVRFDWKDSNRNREVPVKIYYPAKGAGPFPVIVFSHGLGGTREGYEYLGRQWAANGYICVHLQHIGSDDSVWRNKDQPMQSMKQAASAKNSIDRPKDVKFAVDQLEELNKNDPKLRGKLDLNKLAIAGHSFGAQTSMLIAGQRIGGAMIAARVGDLSDNRFKAVLAMSESVPVNRSRLDEIYANIKIPTFYMSGTEDDSPLGDTKASDRHLPFDHTNAKPTYFLNLAGGDHMVFSGRLGTMRPTDEGFQKLIRLASTAFLDAYLKDDAAAKKWLNEDGFKNVLGEQGTFQRK